jgi:hypothetical protein
VLITVRWATNPCVRGRESRSYAMKRVSSSRCVKDELGVELLPGTVTQVGTDLEGLRSGETATGDSESICTKSCINLARSP